MGILEGILESYQEEELVKLGTGDEFDGCIIGLEDRDMRLIYSVSKILRVLESQGMSEIDAIEHFSYNINSAWVGEQTPIYCIDKFLNF